MSLSNLIVVSALSMFGNFAAANSSDLPQCVQETARALDMNPGETQTHLGMMDHGGAAYDCKLEITYDETSEISYVRFSMEVHRLDPKTNERVLFMGANTLLMSKDDEASARRVTRCEVSAEKVHLDYSDKQKWGRRLVRTSSVELTRNAQGQIVAAKIYSDLPFNAGTPICHFNP